MHAIAHWILSSQTEIPLRQTPCYARHQSSLQQPTHQLDSSDPASSSSSLFLLDLVFQVHQVLLCRLKLQPLLDPLLCLV